MLEMWHGLTRGEDELFTSLLHKTTQIVVHRVEDVICGATYEYGYDVATLGKDITQKIIEFGVVVPVTTMIPVDRVFDAVRTIQVCRVVPPTEKETE